MGEKKRHESKKKSGKPKILISIMTIVLVGGVFFGAYYFMSNRTNSQYISSLKDIKESIDKANDFAANSISGVDSIDIKDTEKISKAKSDMSKAETQIQSALENLKKVSPPAKYINQYNSYVNGVTLNKKIYTQAYLILKNTKSKDLENAINALYKYVSDSTAAYDAAKLGKSYVELPSDILTLPDKLHQFAFKSYNDYEAKNRLLEQYNAYFDSMDKIIKSYQDTQSDLNVYINNIKNNTTTIENVYMEIEKKLTALTDIQNSYLNLTVPPKAAQMHQDFNSILKRYISYCQDFKATLTKLEEAGQDEGKIQEVIFTFDELQIRYKEIAKAFTDYRESYNGNKALFSDTDNL